MLKKIVLASILLSGMVNSSEYIATIDKSSYLNSVQISCESPLILNADKTNCVSAVPSCVLPMVLNNDSSGCINSIDKLDWISRDDTCGG